MTLPEELLANAWVEGTPVGASKLDIAPGYLAEKIPTGLAPLKPGELAPLSDWRHGDVGWGLVLPRERPALCGGAGDPQGLSVAHPASVGGTGQGTCPALRPRKGLGDRGTTALLQRRLSRSRPRRVGPRRWQGESCPATC